MRITHLSIRNYRSIEHLDIPINDYSVLVGANGSGKSSTLYALDWFVNGGSLDLSDIHGLEAEASSESIKTVSVTVAFSDLTSEDRERLQQYGRGKTTTFRRSWTYGEKDKVVGNALQGPGFGAVRNAGKVGDARAIYSTLRSSHPELTEPPRLASVSQLSDLLSEWEGLPENAHLLETVTDENANHLFGFNGPNVIKQCVRLVLVPAASDIASEVAGAKRGSAVNELIGALMTDAGTAARSTWIAKNTNIIDDLTSPMRESVKKATGLQANRINERLNSLVANADVTFTTSIGDWVPSPAATVTTDVTIEGITNDVSRQGHGIQRAVMIAMFQSLAPDEALTDLTHAKLEGESDEDAEARLEAEKSDLPALVICIEEPEIYQHPIRARAFARVLAELSTQSRVQVIVATHSPYFVRPEQFASLRRFSLVGGKTSALHTSPQSVAKAESCDVSRINRVVAKQLPTSFSEGFFADMVVLVEGDTDKVVLEHLAERLGQPLDSSGIAVLHMGGKGSLNIPAALLRELGIPTYIVTDGDALGASRKYPTDPAKAAAAHASHKKSTETIMSWLPAAQKTFYGTLPYSFTDSTLVCDRYTIWEDDIEEELHRWPSYIKAQATNSHDPRAKDMLSYRMDVSDADVTDVPSALRACIEALHVFREANT